MGPLTRWSPLVRGYWWLLFLTPPFTLITALDTARTARSADEAVGHAFLIAPMLLLAVATAPFLLWGAFRSAALERTDRAVVVALGLSAAPFVLLVAAIADRFDGWPRGADPSGRAAVLAATALWLTFGIAARRRLHRGIPGGWPQLHAGAWLVLALLLPPVTLFLVLMALVPSEPQDPGPYPAWPFQLAAAALTLLLVHRVFSSRATRGERVGVMLSGLSVAPMVLFVLLAWYVVGEESPDGKWAALLALAAGWGLVASRARRTLSGR